MSLSSSLPSGIMTMNRGFPSSTSLDNDDDDDDSDDSRDADERGGGMKGTNSCPNLAGMGGGAELDEKKQRKLARNRASARLRRLKKKTLIETLEQDMADIDDVRLVS